MTTKEKIVKRLNKAFGFDIPLDCPYHHHGGRGLFTGGWSWGVSNGAIDIGSSYPMTECLKWKRWAFSKKLHEIFEYTPAYEKYADARDMIIEEVE